jgi:hypothetical protein
VSAASAPGLTEVARDHYEYQRIRGCGAGGRTVLRVTVRGARRRDEVKRFLNIDCILVHIFLGSKFSGRIVSIGFSG